MDKIAIDKARSLYYGLFSKLFVFTEDKNRYIGVTQALKVIIENPINDDMKASATNLLKYFEDKGETFIAQEYDDIFFNPDGELVRTSASYYDEEIENGYKKLEVKNFLAKTKIRKDEKHFTESEDNIDFLMTFMHELIELNIEGKIQYKPIEYSLFNEVINSFINEFTKELYASNTAVAYKEIATMINVFVEFERLYLDIEKPAPRDRKTRDTALEGHITQEELARRERNKNKKKKPIDYNKIDDDIQDVETEIDY